LVAVGDRALADSKLPRATAIAARASALAPDDPNVAALVRRVTEGGRARYRRRSVAIGVIAVVALGGAAGGVAIALRSHDVAPTSRDAATAESSTQSRDADNADAPVDVVAIVTPDARTAEPRSHAATISRDASAIVIDAGEIAVAIDAGDAGSAIVPAIVAMGTIAVTSDHWCDVAIDGGAAKRWNPGAALQIRVTAGHHDVTCEQSGTGRGWTRSVDVVAGATTNVSGNVLGDVTVTSEIDATIDGVHIAPGGHIVLKADNHHLVAHGADKYTTIREACVVRDQPALDCYAVR
jgi:hypothetical protein